MPLQSGGVVEVPPGGGGGGSGPGPGAPPESGPFVGLDLPTATWIDPRGGVWPLTEAPLGWFMTAGLLGINSAAPVAITSDDDPRGGTKVRHIQPGSRRVTVPMLVEGRTQTEFQGRYRTFSRAFTSTRRYGPGLLVITRPDGTQREIEAYYEAGWADTPDGSLRWELVALTLYCPSPFWRARVPITETRGYRGSTLPSYLSVFPQVATSLSLGQRAIVSNPGDVEAWPTWTIRGPLESVVAINHTLAKSWTLSAAEFRGSPLALGETVTVSTDPATLVGPLVAGETNWTGALNWPGAQLWSLDEGPNDIEYTATGGSSGSSVSLSFKPRYETS